MKKQMLFASVITLLIASPLLSQQKADLLVLNATVYTIDSSFSKAEAIAVENGKIIGVGTSTELNKKFQAKTTYDARENLFIPASLMPMPIFLTMRWLQTKST